MVFTNTHYVVIYNYFCNTIISDIIISEVMVLNVKMFE